MLENMFLGNPPGNYDWILDFSTAVTGTLFFVPTADFLDDPPALPGATSSGATSSRATDGSTAGASPADSTPPPAGVSPADGSLGLGGLSSTSRA
jgi:putative iron-dependent peroxidase